jgi:hypothetical protein
MKKIFYLTTMILITISCNAQTYPLRTFIDIPENSYLKDTNNELQYYGGTWKGEWNGKKIYLTFNKITNQYDDTFKYYRDFLVARFKVTDLNGSVLYDNTNLPDNNVKIQGLKFRKLDDKYSFIYIDEDLCSRSGNILINFTDSTKTKLEWKYSQSENWINKDCFYHGWAQADVPQPLPNNIILTKQ